MTGASPAAMVALLEGMGADAIGVNCSLGPKALAPIVEEYLKYASVPVLLKPNAGLPCSVCGKTHYDVSAADFAAEVSELVKKGVSIAGGCCGTTPEYITATVRVCEGIEPLEIEKKKVMLDNGDSCQTLAKFLNMNQSTFSSKLHENGSAIRKSEIQNIVNRYNLDAEQIKKIFFNQ